MRELKQSTAANVMVFMTDSADHIAGKTGLTLTITASKDGAAFASITPTVTERGDGWYNLALTSSHTDTLGDLAIHITSTGADPTDMAARIIAMDKAVAATPANVTQIGGVAQSATDLKDFADTGYDPVTHKVQGVVLTDTTTTAAAVTGLNTANLDATISSRLASASYTAPDNAGISSAASNASTAAAAAATAATNSGTILDRIGAFTGSGLNTILGFFRALMRKTAALTPSDVGGTFDNTTDSNEAIKDSASGLSSDQDAALTRIDRTVKGIASKRD